MTRNHRQSASGMVLVFALITVVLMSLLGTTLMKAALFHERLSTNGQLDQLSFLSAESAIAASMAHLESDAHAREAVIMGNEWEACLQSGGITSQGCERAEFVPMPTGIPVAASARSRYIGESAVPGFSVDQVVYRQFSTEGRAHYDARSAIPFGHLNRQAWRRMDAASGVFQQ